MEKLLQDNGSVTGVQTSDGATHSADHTKAACDGHTVLFDWLGGEHLSPEHIDAYSNWPLFKPIVMVGIGLRNHPVTRHHNMVHLPISPVMIGSTPCQMYSAASWSGYDSSLAPPHGATIQLQYESDWSLWDEISASEYRAEKRQIEDDVLDLLELHIPELRSSVQAIDIATPKTSVRYTGVCKGAYEGFYPTGKELNGLPSELPNLQRFSLIGQWQYPGGGLPPSAQSGKWIIERLRDKPFS